MRGQRFAAAQGNSPQPLYEEDSRFGTSCSHPPRVHLFLPNIYSSKNASRWWEKPIPIANLKKHIAPRLSLEDLVSFSQPPVVIDIRSAPQYERAHYGGSINVDRNNHDFGLLEPFKGKPIVVVAERGKKGHKVHSPRLAHSPLNAHTFLSASMQTNW